MTTLLSRIQQLVTTHAGGSARGLSVKAGLSSSYLGTLQTRLRKNPEATMDVPSAQKLAAACGVTVGWLLEGEEATSELPQVPSPEPRERTIELDPRYQAIEVAIAYHPGRWSPSEIAAARSVALEAESLTPKQATAILDAAAERLKGFRLGDVEVGEDEALPRRAKRK